jgi:DNA invertase Pin-like site-specific DNA recombinase
VDVFCDEAGAMSVGSHVLVWLAMGAIVLVGAAIFAKTMRTRDRKVALTPDAPPPPPAPPRPSTPSTDRVVIGYLVVAPRDDDDEESARAIEVMCERSGWHLLEIVRDSDEGRSLERPGLRYALERILAREATGLIVNDVGRLSRSLVDLGALMEWLRDAGATFVVLDLDVDTATPEGRHVANTLIALSMREHDRIAAATREGLARGRATGQPTGRPAVSHRPDLADRIASMRAANMTLSAIAEQLNAEGVPTLRGGKKWRPSSIQAALGYQRPRHRDRLPSPQVRTDRTPRTQA